eukprot:TRINITY_DN12680_c0_g1_i1.p1 TRINITY_DN12680_c0_g1~~TRINITY_DN12680_c0_g1_i1.p1  ORF type:complete len:473 (+),score=78.82 TRINITY_DN12680_c0_g1_i1:132-1550(+)
MCIRDRYEAPYSVGDKLRSEDARREAVIEHAGLLQIASRQKIGIQMATVGETLTRTLLVLRGSIMGVGASGCVGGVDAGSPRPSRRRQQQLPVVPTTKDPFEYAALHWLTTTTEGFALPPIKAKKAVTILVDSSQASASFSVKANDVDASTLSLGPFAYLALVHKIALYERHWLFPTCDTVPWFTTTTTSIPTSSQPLYQSVYLQELEERESIRRFQNCYQAHSRELERIYVLFHMLIPVSVDFDPSIEDDDDVDDAHLLPPPVCSTSNSKGATEDPLIPQHNVPSNTDLSTIIPSIKKESPLLPLLHREDTISPTSTPSVGPSAFLPPLLRRTAVEGRWTKRSLPTIDRFAAASLSKSATPILLSPKSDRSSDHSATAAAAIPPLGPLGASTTTAADDDDDDSDTATNHNIEDGTPLLSIRTGRDDSGSLSIRRTMEDLSLIHISEPTRLLSISYAVFCLKKKKRKFKIPA